MEILLITNDLQYIEEYSDNPKIDIINSILLAPALIENYQYVIIDENLPNKDLQNIDSLKAYYDKILIVGYQEYEGFKCILKEDFDIDNMSELFTEPNDTRFVYNKEDPPNEILEKLLKCDDNFVVSALKLLPCKLKFKMFVKSNMTNRSALLRYLFKA